MLEVVISMAVLTVGLISLLGVFGVALAATQDTQQNMIAKQIANEALESIVTARNSSQLQWDSIQNKADGGIFLNNFQTDLRARHRRHCRHGRRRSGRQDPDTHRTRRLTESTAPPTM